MLNLKELSDTPKYVLYVCWHVVTIALFLMAAGFLYSTFYPDTATDVALTMTILAGAISIFGIILAPAVKQSYAKMPQGWFFAPITVLGVLGAIV